MARAAFLAAVSARPPSRAAEAAWAYPSLIDPSSPAADFGAADDDFRLYLVRMPLGPDCRVGPERDLVWFPVSWRKP